MLDFERLELPPTADMHVHLREGGMMETVTPLIGNGGVDTVFVMVGSEVHDARMAQQPTSSTTAIRNVQAAPLHHGAYMTPVPAKI